MLTWDHVATWLGTTAAIPSGLKSGEPPHPAHINRDTRTLKSGEWYLPIRGERFDGHDFIANALASGARGFFYARAAASKIPPELLERGIAVDDTVTAFQAIASGWRGLMTGVRLAAMTGSTGKTTVKEMLSRIMVAAGPTLTTEGSFNNEIGVPLTLARLTSEHRYGALEFGARHVGDIAFLNRLVRPNVCTVLNVGMAHVGEFGSIENLLHTKLEMFRDAPKEATLVAIHDDRRIVDAALASGHEVVTFGHDPQATVRIVGAKQDASVGMTIELLVRGKPLTIELPSAHVSHPINAAAACAIAHAVGIDGTAMAEGLKHFHGVKGRFVIHRFQGFVVIDDTYNANPQSMTAGLDSLASSFPRERKLVVLGDMRELGPESRTAHEAIGRHVATAIRPTRLVTVGTESLAIRSAAIDAGLDATETKHFATVDDLIRELPSLRAGVDLLYAKASNSLNLAKLITSFQSA